MPCKQLSDKACVYREFYILTNETQAPLYVTLSPTSYELDDVFYLVLSHC